MTSMTPINKMVQALEKAFGDYDQKHLEADLQWHRDTHEAGRLLDQQLNAGEVDLSMYDGHQLRRHVALEMRIKAYGGKTLFNAFTLGGWNSVAEQVQKNHEGKVAKRNHRIVRDLAKAGITEVIDGMVDMSPDGFDGFFLVLTDQGKRKVRVSTLYCHGQIKRPHFRVVVRVSAI